MNISIVANYLGQILRVEAAFMLPAFFIALYKGERSSAAAFALTIAILMVIGTLFAVRRGGGGKIYSREGFAIVALSWILMSLTGAFPFFLSGAIPSFVDCFFETVSGFTTTGASILTDVETMPMSLLYWRSFTHWLGGMGILVFALAVVPMSKEGASSVRILRAESPGPEVGKLVPKMRHTARILYVIYIVLTLVEIIFLRCGGMPLFDSVLHSFGTAGTGGFSIKNASIGAYDSVYLQTVIGVFMFLFGVNFNIFYLALLRDFRSIRRNSELRLYFTIVVLSVAAITVNTLNVFSSPLEALRHSFFQVSSIITTTGYATTDFDLWPEFSRSLLLILMVVGACAGSTGGGIKVSRVLILFKSIRNSVQKMLHPRSVKPIKIDGNVIEENTVREVNVFITVYLVIICVSVLAVSLDNCSFDTTISAVFACVNNIGPGLGLVGPVGNYSTLSVLSKLVLSADMLFGRLEIFPLLLLFAPSMWRRGMWRGESAQKMKLEA